MENNTLITRAEHEEFRRRMEDVHKRQDKRIELLEKNTKQIGDLTLSVGKLAQSIEIMCNEQKQQGERLETLENRDGEKWRKIVGYVVTAVIGIILGLVAKQIGL